MILVRCAALLLRGLGAWILPALRRDLVVADPLREHPVLPAGSPGHDAGLHQGLLLRGRFLLSRSASTFSLDFRLIFVYGVGTCQTLRHALPGEWVDDPVLRTWISDSRNLVPAMAGRGRRLADRTGPAPGAGAHAR
jgi:hypothetical protein